MSNEPISVYCDGGVVRANPSPYAGTWAYLYVQNGKVIREQSGVLLPRYGLDGAVITNNVTELYALCLALQEYNRTDTPFTVYSDSMIALRKVFDPDMPDNWIPTWLRELLCHARIKVGILKPDRVLLKGHPSKAELLAGVAAGGSWVSRYNVRCDELCKSESTKFMLERAAGEPLTAQV